MTRPKLIVPRDYGQLRTRPRLAPPARPRAGAEGWLEWTLIDRRGNAVRGGQQHNLILDGGLDRFASRAINYVWMGYACVGTDSTAPDVTDTALGAEVGRSSTTIDSGVSEPSAGVSRIRVVREFDFGQANGNLTEWGIASASSGELNVRELFRDGQGDPITVTKTVDYKLRIDYTLEMTLSPITPTAFSLPITGIGVLSAKHTFNSQAASVGRWSEWATGAAERWWAMSAAWTYATVSNNQSAANSVPATAAAYVPGSYQRSHSGPVVWGTSAGNHLWRSVSGGRPGAGLGRSWGFEIDEDDRFTKDDLHILTLTDLMTFSWGRA